MICAVPPVSIVRLRRKFPLVLSTVVDPAITRTAPSHSPDPAILWVVPLKRVSATPTVPLELLVKVVPVKVRIPVPVITPPLLRSPSVVSVVVAEIVTVAPPFTVIPATLALAARMGLFATLAIVTLSAAEGTTPPQPLQFVGSAQFVEVVPAQVQAAPKARCGATSMNTAISTVMMVTDSSSGARRMISSLKIIRLRAKETRWYAPNVVKRMAL